VKILADHCVPDAVVRAARDEGHEVTRLVDIRDPGLADRQVARAAAELGAILLTADRDFARRKDFPPKRFNGIILLKDMHAAPERIVRRLLRLLETEQGRREGKVTVLDRRSGRVRR
jgi:predicted nuclease of predicted toxin-antitoxin system